MVILIVGTALNAQVNLGTISGVVYEADDSTTTIPFVKVWVSTESGMRPTFTDDQGRYKIDALKPGIYNLNVKSIGYDSLLITQISVRPNAIVTVNGYCGNMMETIVIRIPLIIPKEIPRIEIPIKDIEHSPYFRNPLGLLAATSSDIQFTEGSSEIIIRGSRPGDAIYYVDGVKTSDMSSVPGTSIGALEAYTGGIPAKYGDTTGGVIVLETKSYFDLYNAWKYSH